MSDLFTTEEREEKRGGGNVNESKLEGSGQTPAGMQKDSTPATVILPGFPFSQGVTPLSAIH